MPQPELACGIMLSSRPLRRGLGDLCAVVGEALRGGCPSDDAGLDPLCKPCVDGQAHRLLSRQRRHRADSRRFDVGLHDLEASPLRDEHVAASPCARSSPAGRSGVRTGSSPHPPSDPIAARSATMRRYSREAASDRTTIGPKQFLAQADRPATGAASAAGDAFLARLVALVPPPRLNVQATSRDADVAADGVR